MASAAFTIESLTHPPGVAVAAGATVDLALVSITGVRTVSWTILGGSDSTKTPPTITPAGSPSGSTASFVMNTPVGAVGLTWLIRCVVNGGVDDEGTVDAALTSTGIVGVANSKGYLPFATGETLERNATNGITDDFNAEIILSAGGAPMPNGTVNGAIATWSTGGAAWVETTSVRVTGGSVDITTNNLVGTGFAALSGGGSYVAIGASPAGAGQVRLPSSWSIVGKTAAAADQIVLSWGLSAADVIALGNFGGAVARIEAVATTQIDLYVASALRARFTDTTADFQNNNLTTSGVATLTGGGSYIAIGTSPANLGAGRFTDGTGIYWNNGSGTAVRGMTALTGTLLIGEIGTNGVVGINYYTKTGSSHQFYVDAALQFKIDDTTIDAQNNNIVTTGYGSYGASPPASGTGLRVGGTLVIANATGIFGDSAPAGTPVLIAQVQADESLLIGTSGSSGTTYTYYDTKTSGAHHFAVNGATEASISASALSFHNGTDSNFALYGNGEAMIGLNIAASGVRNVAFFNDGSGPSGGWDSMDGGLFIANAVAAPSGDPAAGGYMYLDAGTFAYRVAAATVNSKWLVGGTQKAFIDGNGLSVHQLRVGTGTTPATDNGYIKITAGAGDSDGFNLVCKFPSAGEVPVIGADETTTFGSAINIGGTTGGSSQPSIVCVIGATKSFVITNSNLDEVYNYNDTSDAHQWGINDAIKMTLDTTALVLASGYTVDFGLSDALGGGAGATLGTIGGTGPTAAAQSKWLEIKIGGTAHWVPAWV